MLHDPVILKTSFESVEIGIPWRVFANVLIELRKYGIPERTVIMEGLILKTG